MEQVYRLLLSHALRSKLAIFAENGYPHETCGLLIGTYSTKETRVARVTQARNLNTTRPRDRYELDPLDFLAAQRTAQSVGLEVVGVWHSHPNHPARPSETDRADAWPEWSYVIAAVTQSGVDQVRAWRLKGDEFHEEHIQS